MGTSAVTPILHTSICDTGTAGAGSDTQLDGGKTCTLAPFQNPHTSSSLGRGPWCGTCRAGTRRLGRGWGLARYLVPMLACPPAAPLYVGHSTHHDGGGDPGVSPQLCLHLLGQAVSLEREGET